MNPFKTTPEKKLDAARANRDKLAERLAAAETAISERASSAQRLARDGASDAELETAETALRASRDRRDTLSAALVEMNQQVAALERERDELADRKLRAETAATIEALAVEITTVGAAFDVGLSALGETCGRAAELVHDAKGLEVFAARVHSEVPTTVHMIAGLLRDRARATIAGTAPASLPQSTPTPAPEPLPPSPAMQNIFVIRHIKYTDHDGNLRLCYATHDAEVPLAVAARALACGAAFDISDPRRKTMRGIKSPRVLDPSLYENMDVDAEQREPVMGTAFTSIERGRRFKTAGAL